MFIVIITHLKGIISEFLKKELKILEILLVKWINSTEKYKNKIESCVIIKIKVDVYHFHFIHNTIYDL